MENSARVTAWNRSELPTEAAISAILNAEGLSYQRWSNPPLDVYFAHSHPFNKVIYVVEGAITFDLPKENISFTLQVGDRLDLPAGVIHEATISTLGVACLEAHF